MPIIRPLAKGTRPAMPTVLLDSMTAEARFEARTKGGLPERVLKKSWNT
jgi:hypothetical protein